MRKIYLLLVVLLFASCANQKKIIYLQDVPLNAEYEVIQGGEIRLKCNDVVSIYVSSKTPELATVFNLLRVNQSISEDSSSLNIGAGEGSSLSYTVKADGTIDFPVLGKIKVEGLTRDEVSEHIKSLIMDGDYINDPIVTVEFSNLSFTTLGDMGSVDVYEITKDRTTILEAISMAGDLAITGLRDGIYVTRQEGDKLITYNLDITSKDIFQSPAYYIQQNDLIYVRPNNMKSNSTTVNGNTLRTISFWTSMTSILTTLSYFLF